MSTDLVVPALGESISEAVIARWLKKVGEPISTDEPVVDLETDKVSVQLPAPTAGILSEQRFAEGATVRVGAVIGRIQPKNGDLEAARPAPTVPERKPQMSVPVVSEVPASQAGAAPSRTPSQRKALREGVEVVPVAVAPVAVAAKAPAPLPPAPAPASAREDVVPMSPLRRRIAERLVEAQHTAAILTTFNEVDMSQVLELRARHQEAFVAKHGMKLGFMSFFTKACVAALKDFPGLNAEVRGNDIVYKKHYDLGVAVGSGRGLVVPVLRRADELGFAEIEKGIAALGAKAKDNKLTLDDLTGGTFTITNGGIYGSMMSTPLLNLPQTGILGMHNIVQRPVAVGTDIALRPMMYLALSYDHRVVDGREAVQFLVSIKQRLEEPSRLLFAI
jgi:2-oxoglutarate dehydrogenase E2 component (dihydrolipoamide succinyltransferase)